MHPEKAIIFEFNYQAFRAWARAYKNKWNRENRDKATRYVHNWCVKNRARSRELHNKSRLRNIESARNYDKKRNVGLRKLRNSITSHINLSLHRKGLIKNSRTLRLLGCSIEKFKQHLESLFLPGMSWANRCLWHIDHKRPISSFDLTTGAGQRAAFHYTNCQPLWAVDNLRKGAKIV